MIDATRESAPAIDVDRDGLRDFYERLFLAMFHADVRPGTIIEMRSTIRTWESIVGHVPLAAITNDTMMHFRQGLLERPGQATVKLSPGSVNKHLRNINHLLGKAGPAGHGNRDALSLLEKVPWVKHLKQPRRLPRAPSLDAIGRMYAAAAAARLPIIPGVTAEVYWQGLICTAYNLGSRRRALLSIRDEDIDWQRRLVRFSADGDKCHSDRLKPLARIALDHLRPLRGRGVLFGWAHGSKGFYNTWHEIQDAAHLDGEERFTIHDLKRACGSNLAKLVSPWATRYQLDHAQRDVSGSHYIDPLQELVERVDDLPQPEQFRLPGDVVDEPTTTEPLYVDAFAFGSLDDGALCAMADPWNPDNLEDDHA